MPLGEPPLAAGSLSDVPQEPLRGRELHRVWRAVTAGGSQRESPWWFASVGEDPSSAGRFDLPAPMGTCYLATSAVAAVLEALQLHLVNLPREELAIRRRATVVAPENAPPAARLTARHLAGAFGVTAALWAGSDRPLTQRWAAAFRRDGWWALYAGTQHDPSGQLRGVALFDHAGAHEPSLGGTWPHETTTLHDDEALVDGLATHGVTVRARGDLPFKAPTKTSPGEGENLPRSVGLVEDGAIDAAQYEDELGHASEGEQDPDDPPSETA